MFSFSIFKQYTKFQPNWWKNAKVMHIFHFEAGWEVGQFGQLAYWILFKSNLYVESFHLETTCKVSTKFVEKCQSYASFSLLGRLAGWVVGRFGQLACSNAYKSHTHVESFQLETPYQISTKSVEKCQSYARFSLLGQ